MKTWSEEEIDELGSMLEDKGMNHSEIDSYFLQHWGVKGMRWGVRHKRRETSRSGISRRGKFKLARNVGLALGGGALVGLGSAYVIKNLRENRRVPVKEISRMPFAARGKDWVVEAGSGEALDVFFKTLKESGRTLS